MEDQLISFDTAKLAKEKGFDEDVISMYGGQDNPQIEEFDAGIYMMWELTKAPTQSLLQKWLRESKLISVICDYNKCDEQVVKYGTIPRSLYQCCIVDLRNDNIITDTSGYGSLKYEEALEDALQEALKLIN